MLISPSNQALLRIQLITAVSILNNSYKDSSKFASESKRLWDKKRDNSTTGKDLISRNNVTTSYSSYINSVLYYNSLFNCSSNQYIGFAIVIYICDRLCLITQDKTGRRFDRLRTN